MLPLGLCSGGGCPPAWPPRVASSYCSSGGCPAAAVAANLSSLNAFSTLAYYVAANGTLGTCNPDYAACTWTDGEVDAFNEHTARATGAAPQPLVFSNSGDMVSSFRALVARPDGVAEAARFLAERAKKYRCLGHCAARMQPASCTCTRTQHVQLARTRP